MKKITTLILEKGWDVLFRTATWIITVIGAFFFPPPGFEHNNEDILWNFTRFGIIALISIMIVPMNIWRSRRYILLWILITSLSFITVSVGFFLYNSWLNQDTINYNNIRFVKGNTYTPLALKWRQTDKNLTDAELLEYSAGNREKIWTSESIRNNETKLGIAYFLSVLAAAFCLLSSIQLFTFSMKREKIENIPEASSKVKS